MENNDFLIETENSYFIKKEDIEQLKNLEDFCFLSDYIEKSEVMPSYFNVIGFYKEKTVIIL